MAGRKHRAYILEPCGFDPYAENDTHKLRHVQDGQQYVEAPSMRVLCLIWRDKLMGCQGEKVRMWWYLTELLQGGDMLQDHLGQGTLHEVCVHGVCR